METNHEMRWVTERMSALEPAWQADLARGMQLLDAGQEMRTRSHSWIAATAAAAVCVAAITLPQTRAIAQQLWSHFFLNRVEVVHVDFSDLPLHNRISSHGMPQEARDLDEAERLAGFRPFLPESGVPAVKPPIVVLSAMDITQTIRIAEFEAALRKAHVTDVQVPAEWEGVPLRYSIGPIVVLEYPNDIGILEAKPIEFSIPAGFPLQRFGELAFRTIGLSGHEAGELARKFAANPAWLLDVPADERADVEQIVLRSGPGLLIQEFNDDGKPGRVTVLRSTNERIYCVETNSRQQSLAIGDALP